MLSRAAEVTVAHDTTTREEERTLRCGNVRCTDFSRLGLVLVHALGPGARATRGLCRHCSAHPVTVTMTGVRMVVACLAVAWVATAALKLPTLALKKQWVLKRMK